MFGLSIEGPGRRTADPVPKEITGYEASERTRWASIDLMEQASQYVMIEIIVLNFLCKTTKARPPHI